MKKTIYLIVICSSLILAGCGAISVYTTTPSQTPTSKPTGTSTLTPTITPTATIAPTATPQPLKVVFKEDFIYDPLGWGLVQPNYLNTYSENGLELWYEGYYKPDYGFWRIRPIKTVTFDGDFDIDIVFDRRVRFSGIWLSNESLGFGGGYYVMIEQGQYSDDWKKEIARFGIVLPNQEFKSLGKIEDYIQDDNGYIHLHLSFRDDQMSATVNGSPVIRYKNNFFSGKKYFVGFAIGAQDNFIVNDLQFLTAGGENYEIVEVAKLEWEKAEPTFAVISSMTPPEQTSTPTPGPLTSPVAFTIDNFTGRWQNVDPNTRGTAKITISKEGNTIMVHTWGKCGPGFCDQGVVTTLFEGNPVVVYRDGGFFIEKIIILREGNFLYVREYSHFTDGSGRSDRIDEYIFRR